MKKTVKYEWTNEVIDRESGDILDSDFSDTLSFSKEDFNTNDIGLVRDEGNEIDGITNRHWAYIKDGKLPEYFSNSLGHPTKFKVPTKFHKELSKYISL